MGDKTSETGPWRGDTEDDRDLGSRSRAIRQRVQDGQWRPARWKIVWTGDPRL